MIRLARAAARIDFQIQGTSVGSLKLLLNEMEDYQNGLRAYRDWRAYHPIALARSVRTFIAQLEFFSELNDEARRIQRNYDPSWLTVADIAYQKENTAKRTEQ